MYVRMRPADCSLSTPALCKYKFSRGYYLLLWLTNGNVITVNTHCYFHFCVLCGVNSLHGEKFPGSNLEVLSKLKRT